MKNPACRQAGINEKWEMLTWVYTGFFRYILLKDIYYPGWHPGWICRLIQYSRNFLSVNHGIG